MTPKQAIEILIPFLNRLTLSPAEAWAINEAVKVLSPSPSSEATNQAKAPD